MTPEELATIELQATEKDRLADEVKQLRKALFDYSTDPEDCDACVAADALWPAWRHGSCPYHLGVSAGITHTCNQITNTLTEL
jgi:hypothetical protein